MANPTPEQIDAILPQTQCGLCDYAGCLPYAKAIAHENEVINHCLPGGVSTLKTLAQLTRQDPTPFLPEMQQKAKPASIAVIDEDACIGCTKCIQACPVDAIFGASKLMHTVITAECTGCELCVEPCPVDCIDMVTITEPDAARKKHQADLARKRYQFRNARLERDKSEKREQQLQAKLKQAGSREDIILARKAAIQAAIARTQAKKII